MRSFANHFENHIAPKKEIQSEKINSPESLLTKLEMERRQLASEIAREGNYEEIAKNLEEKDLLLEQMNRIQQEYEPILGQASFLFQEDSLEIWKALTILELYDTDTFKHSLGTYAIAKSKIESPIVINGETIDLKKMIENEGLVSLEQFYKACLLHDIGKIEVPHFLIASQVKNSEWAELLLDLDEKDGEENSHSCLNEMLAATKTKLPAEIESYPETTLLQQAEKKGMLIKFLAEKELPCINYVPVVEALDNPILGLHSYTTQDMQDLEKRGFSKNSPLLEIIKAHEKKSKIILESLNLENEAELVSTHHDYEDRYVANYEKHPLTISSFTLSKRLSELLRLADMHEAIHTKRSYANERSQIDSLIILAKSISKQKIHPLIAHVWLTDALQKITSAENIEPEKVATLEKYIETFKDEWALEA